LGRGRSVRLLARLCDESLADLALHHHDEAIDLRYALEQVDHQGHRDVVGQVRDHGPPLVAEELPPVGAHRVELLDVDVRIRRHDLAKRRRQTAVELHGQHVAPGLAERDGDRAEPGPDLDDAVTTAHAGVGDDRAGQIRVGDEVLPERLRRADPVTLGERPQSAEPEVRAPASTGCRATR
jgi:hypothetical protein